MAADAAQALKARAVSLGAPPALPSFCFSDWVLFKEAERLAMKELEAEWAREAQEASDSDDDVEHIRCVTCHLRNRSTRAYLTFPIVLFTCTAGGGRWRVKSDSLL